MSIHACSNKISFDCIRRFLKGSLELGLHLKLGPLRLIAYSDGDWAGNPIDRKSLSDFYIYFGNSPVSWCSQKQPIVVRSSTKSEYWCLAQTTARCQAQIAARCFAQTATELSWLCMLFRDLCIYLLVMPLIVIIWVLFLSLQPSISYPDET